jgi:queuine/archaeosine tRNA-ribosyltransferase
MSDLNNDLDDFELDKEIELYSEKNLLNLSKCDEKSSSVKLKGRIKKEILPELDIMEQTNSKIMLELEEILTSTMESKTIENANEETLQRISEVLLYHAIIEDHIIEIRETTDKL